MNGKRNGKGEEYKYIPCEKRDNFFKSQELNKNIKRITLFSGEYINGERKEGKEYNYNGEVVYEGEYFKGKRNGKGKLYINKYNCGDLKYAGEFLNNKKHGKGIEYENYQRSKYVGKFFNGKREGKGKEYIDKNFHYYLIFEGEYYNNYRLKGKEYYENGKLKFDGKFLFGEKYNGKIYDYNGIIIFELINGNAKIEEENDIIKILIGENLDAKKIKENIEAKEYDYEGRLLFEGEYLNKDRWKGKYKEYHNNKLVFEGDYLKGIIWNGKGVNYNYNGDKIFEGEYLNGEKNGYIREYEYNFYYNRYQLLYEGNVVNGLKNGEIKEYGYHGKLKFEGEYVKGEKNGNAKAYNSHGNLIFEGIY